jgi:hypothetical protein
MHTAPAFFSWGGGGKTGKYRYSQRSFDVNELVAALGVVTAGMTVFLSCVCERNRIITHISVCVHLRKLRGISVCFL